LKNETKINNIKISISTLRRDLEHKKERLALIEKEKVEIDIRLQKNLKLTQELDVHINDLQTAIEILKIRSN
jgi:hypothetical protein|tara:strand:- start:301 stop:516 length:216 start_codon:yes stop_codon:yes gene_type:complete